MVTVVMEVDTNGRVGDKILYTSNSIINKSVNLASLVKFF